MKPRVVDDNVTHRPNSFADLNRLTLKAAGVATVSILGGPGCGKTTLIDATIEALMPEVHVGVIACDVTSQMDADRMARHSEQVIQVTTGERGVIDTGHIRDAIRWLDLRWMDVMFIENVGTLVASPIDLGQDVTVAVFSVAAGHDKAAKHPDIVRAADIIVLNKLDLLLSVPFDLNGFRADVARLNPAAQLFEMSALHGEGRQPWLEWVKARVTKPRNRASAWFG